MKALPGAILTLLLMAMLALGAGYQEAAAQPLEVGKIEAPLEELALNPDADLGGRVAVVQGTADAVGRRYYATRLNVMSPTVIAVFADDPAMPVEISLHRHVWERPDATGVTDAEGNYEFTGRIEDTIGIWIKAEQPSGFQMMFWTDDPVPVEVPPIFYDNDRPVKNSGGE